MKTEISRDSHQPEKRYTGVYQQQGRMLTDADWNELVDILKGRLNDALKDVVGNGSPMHRNVVNNDDANNPPKLKWGRVYVDGILAIVRPGKDATSEADFEYDHQEDFPLPPAKPSASSESYCLYADVWERTVTQLLDDKLRDKGLHGADTCTRKQVMAQVKWCPIDIDPETSSKNPPKGNARATITLLKKSIQPDPCDPCAKQLDVKSRIGNYLFRVEVHDVQGSADAPEVLTLKWSVENGAIQAPCFQKDDEGNIVDIDPPESFTSENWVYEFFDDSSEKHLGVHHAGSAIWEPSRHDLVKETYSKPESAPNSYVRRWDGCCTLSKGSKWKVDKAYDRDKSTRFASVDADNKLTIKLDSHQIELDLDASFVAGDYWLAEVREAENKTGMPLISDELPHGIEHHYLKLGKVVDGGSLALNPEADRKYAFPPLTEMTRMFIAGGDGQEVMPPSDSLKALPQPLRVAVANGEWPVEKAKVRFSIETGGGLLDGVTGSVVVDTSHEGIAECEWKPDSTTDAKYCVKATLVDPADDSNDTDLGHPPLYFYADMITADQVAYTNPVCGSDLNPTVNSLLKKDIDPPDPDLDHDWPDFDKDKAVTVKDVLDALLCKLAARHLPYDPSIKDARWDDINAEEITSPEERRPKTVQAAIDDLVDNLQSEDIKYILPTCASTNTLLSLIKDEIQNKVNVDTKTYVRIKDLWDALMCNLDAKKIPYDPNIKPERWKDIGDLPPTTDPLTAPATVQGAIDTLIENLNTGGGCCSIVVSPGDDIQAKVDSIPFGGDAHICITHGEHLIKQSILVEDKGHILIQGCGPGSRIRAVSSEAALIVRNCKSILFHDLAMQSEVVGKSAEQHHLNGTLSIFNIPVVNVERAFLSCADGSKKMGSCITVANDKAIPNSSVRIEHCYLSPGHRQVGVLVVNAHRAQIEDNEIRVRAKSKRWRLANKLKHRQFRMSMRDALISDISDKPNSTAKEKKLTYNGNTIFFQSPVVQKSWDLYLEKNPPERMLSNKEFIHYLQASAESVLFILSAENADPKRVVDIRIPPAFKKWFNSMINYLPSVAEQGIVCSGSYADDIRILNNSTRGVAQGIHIGLSHRYRKGENHDVARRVRVEGNQTDITLSPEITGERHGIFVGNVDSLNLVANNIRAIRYPSTLGYPVQGIRIYGFFGREIHVRRNHISGFDTGIYARAINPPAAAKCLWRIEFNIIGDASTLCDLRPAGYFIARDNPG